MHSVAFSGGCILHILHYNEFSLHSAPAAFYAVAFLGQSEFACILDLLHFEIVAFHVHFIAFRGGAFWTRSILKNAFATYCIITHSSTFLTGYILYVLQTHAFGCIAACVTFGRPVAFAHCSITTAFVCRRTHYACISRASDAFRAHQDNAHECT